MLLKMAFRNLWRRKFRTLLTALALGLSYAMTVIFMGLADGSHEQMADIGIRLKAGHVVVQGKGYAKKKRLEIRVFHPNRIDAIVHDIDPTVIVCHRIFAMAALRSADGMVRLDSLVGIQPAREAKISEIAKHMVAGSFLKPGQKGIVIGAQAAKRLKVAPGDNVVLTTSGIAGRAQEKMPVKGIFRTAGQAVDTGYAQIDLTTAQRMLGMDHSVTQVALFANLKKTRRLAHELTKRLSANLEILTWKQALPMLSQFLWLDSASMWVMLLLIFAIVAAGVLNTVLMSVMERTKELGVLKAIGMTPRRIFFEVAVEAALLGLIALAIGLAVGLPVNHLAEVHGIDIKAFTGADSFEGAGVAMTGKMYSKLYLLPVLWTSIGMVLLTVLSALYPGWKAARLKPVTAIHRT
ncbi:MAG: ABC transporter permease [Deltaproteobacteria bacterium]|nr:ABC transporter permease [Deltaproteobacteria bacterium]